MVAKKVVVAHSYLEKFFGLMGKKESEFDYALVFAWNTEGRLNRSIHMLFMNFSIMAVFLNKEKKVVDKTVLKPWQWNYTPKEKCQYVVEMPVKNGKIRVGDQWAFQV